MANAYITASPAMGGSATTFKVKTPRNTRGAGSAEAANMVLHRRRTESAPNEDVIGLCEDLLVMAKSGELKGLIFIPDIDGVDVAHGTAGSFNNGIRKAKASILQMFGCLIGTEN
jgi:hypothetical protein